MKLFTLGPVEMFEETMKIGGQQVPYFRNQEFSDIVLRSSQNIKRLLGADDNSQAIFLTGSGTAAMEATVINCFTEADRLLVIDGGGFGHRFVELCELHKIPYVAVKVQENQTLTRQMIEEAAQGQKFTGLLVNIHESSTGQLYDIEMLSDYCKENGLFFVVDAISSFLADPYDVKKYGVDVTILSSQKALSLAPGLSIVVLSDRILKERVEKIPSSCMYLDFKSHLENAKRGQTPFTPAVRVIIELDEILKMLINIGTSAYIDHVKTLAEDFRRKAVGIGLELPQYPMSNAATTIIFPKGNAKKVYEELIEKYGIVVNPNGGHQADYALRVAHIGNHVLEDNTFIIDALNQILTGEK